MKAGDKVVFNGGSQKTPVIVRGTVFQGRSGLLVRDDKGGIVCSPIGWKLDKKEKGIRKEVKDGNSTHY